jgi:UPF0271 protein
MDLNIDLGELPNEPRDLYTLCTVANVACGGHAGDLASMARAVSMCLARGVRLAAHPSYPDREGFGRTTMTMDPLALRASIAEQCAALANVAKRLGHSVTAMKPHGALYHDAARDPVIADALLDGACDALGHTFTVIGPPPSHAPDGTLGSCALLDRTIARGLAYAKEGFADRAYLPDGSLMPRSQAGAVITDDREAPRQALALAREGRVQTICIHGDNPNASAIALAVRGALEGGGFL